MRFDIEDQLCVAQAFVASAVSTNSRQKASAEQDISIGRRMSLMVLPTVAAGAGSTHVMDVVQADNTALTTNLEVLGTITVLAADLIPGAVFEIPIPQGTMDRLHIGFRDTISGGTTEVTLDVYLVPADEISKYKSFPKVVEAVI